MLTSASDLALDSVAHVTGLPVVRFAIDGLEILGALELSFDEHERRAREEVGAHHLCGSASRIVAAAHWRTDASGDAA